MWDLLRAVLGLGVLVLVAWGLAEKRVKPNWKLVVAAFGVMVLAAVLVFQVPGGQLVFVWVNDIVVAVFRHTSEGAKFVFGPLASGPGEEGSLGFIFAFQALPTAVVIAALTALLYHIGVLPLLIRWFARFFRRSLGVSGPESVAAATNLFVGIESALAVRPYLATMRRHELAILLTAGMATIASTVLGLYTAILAPVFPTIAGHLLTANFLSLPAAVLFARLLVPPSGDSADNGEATMQLEIKSNWIQSLTEGSMEGLKLALGIAAVLIAFVGLLALTNAMVGTAGEWFGVEGLTLQRILGWLFAPVAWLIGVPWAEAARVGELLGLRLVATEVPAYFQLSAWLADGTISQRSAIIAAYALCGFAHIPSLGIFAGGITALVPERAAEIGAIALRCLLAATLACLAAGAVGGIFAGAPLLLHD